MKKIYSLLAISALASVGLLGMTPAAKADYYSPQKLTMREETKIVYSCQPQDNQFVTVPQIVQEREWKYAGMVNTLVDEQVVQQYSPVIIWTESLGSKAYPYTPESRCQAVSAHLTNLAKSMSIPNLVEMSQKGVFNYERVIFASNKSHPTVNNVIFTLKPENRAKVSEILVQFEKNISGSVGGTPVDVAPIYE
jgi:hypothetical protein